MWFMIWMKLWVWVQGKTEMIPTLLNVDIFWCTLRLYKEWKGINKINLKSTNFQTPVGSMSLRNNKIHITSHSNSYVSEQVNVYINVYDMVTGSWGSSNWGRKLKP